MANERGPAFVSSDTRDIRKGGIFMIDMHGTRDLAARQEAGEEQERATGSSMMRGAGPLDSAG
jgi:hypothetical protein